MDIHCVTRWSKLDTAWTGVSLDVLLDAVVLRRPLRAGLLRRRLHDEPAGGRPDRREGLGGVQLRRQSAARPSTAARPGCSSRTCTSGRAPSGCAGCGCGTSTSRASGRCTATTCTETHGGNSGTRATDLADRHGRLGDRRDGPGADHLAVGAGLGRPPGRAAPGRQAHRRGRLPGRALLLDRLRARRAGRDHGRAAGRRRGLAVPDGGAAGRATRSRCAARSAATSCGSRRCRTRGPLLLLAGGSGVVPLRAMLRHRARVGSSVPVRLLYSARSWADVIYRSELDRRGGRRAGDLHADQAAAARLDRLRAAGGSADDRRGGLARGAGAAGLRLRPDELRGGRGRATWWRSATRRSGSGPSGSARPAT